MNYEIDEKISNRITILKGLLMVLVVFIHAYREEISYVGKSVVLMPPLWIGYLKYLISAVIARTAVPMFFLISAVLLYRRPFSWKQNMRKKVRTILIPYLILNSFWILFFYVAQNLDFAALYFVTEQSLVSQWGLKGWLDAYFGNVLDAYPLLYPTWFLRDLFVLNLFAVLIKKCVDRMPKVCFFLILCLWLTQLPIPYIGGQGESDQSIVFFVLGYYVVKYHIDLHVIDRIAFWKIGGLYMLFVLSAAALYRHTFHYMVRHMMIIAGIVFFYKVSQVIEESRLREWSMRFARHSFFIFAFHEMNLTIVTKLLAERIPQIWQVQLAEYFLVPVLLITACVCLSVLMKKMIPKGYYVLTGGRG